MKGFPLGLFVSTRVGWGPFSPSPPPHPPTSPYDPLHSSVQSFHGWLNCWGRRGTVDYSSWQNGTWEEVYLVLRSRPFYLAPSRAAHITALRETVSPRAKTEDSHPMSAGATLFAWRVEPAELRSSCRIEARRLTAHSAEEEVLPRTPTTPPHP